ncbi:epidermal growth factor receptor kinase substrate 8 [Engraulis encrasicolus]|uniref:epidermal growth factor receptor kinase substrate 8 n=1 Tax=Engraulis encrasicolus TaxID=184585 RepID=UPI002FD5F7A1
MLLKVLTDFLRTPPSPPRSLGGPPSLRYAKVCYHFVARNPNELSVTQGDILEILGQDKNWWCLRSRSGQEGYVPCNILKATDQPPQRRSPGTLISQPPQQSKAHASSVPVSPYPPTAPITSVPVTAPVSVHVSPPVSAPVNAPVTSVAVSGAERIGRSRSPQPPDSRTQVNDELLQRITSNKSTAPARNYRVDPPTSFPTPLTDQSEAWEVKTWLNAKGFSKMTVSCLGILSGAQLFSLTKDELKAVCGDEGSRVYSQVTVQKTQLEQFQGTTELEVIMRRRQEEVDAFTY